jgi:ComF family protein
MLQPDRSVDRLLALARRGAGKALDLVLPPRCVLCAKGVDSHGALCVACWREIRFLEAPFCACCGLPFPYDQGGDALCPACIAAPPAFARARSAMIYDEHSRKLVLALKHGDRQHGLPAFGTWLARAGADLLGEADIMAPVPLHWTRLFSRRFNQSAMLAYAVAAARKRLGLTHPEVIPDLLERHRRTPSQGGLSRVGRASNVQGAFRLRLGLNIAGKRVLLVDDVLTTGATLEACARLLRRAGAAEIDVLTLARVVRVE